MSVEAVGGRPRADAARHQGRRGDQGDVGAEGAQGDRVGAEDPAVGEVADDGDPGAVEVTEPLLHRVGVEQGLGGVLVGAVAGVDDARVDPLATPGGRRRWPCAG